ncbi:MAG: EVE domain-containing protein [Methanomassiliicoccales archaeon]|nr:EVE domain-containing protein [Methanomassiliicoccales archaeon]
MHEVHLNKIWNTELKIKNKIKKRKNYIISSPCREIMMNHWFVVHDLKAYAQHSDLIGCRVKSHGLREPRFKQFAEIRKGDKIIYYASKNNVVVGIFEITSDITHLERDPFWNEIMVYSIKPSEMPPSGYYLNFKKLVLSKTVKFDLFPDSEKWYNYLQGKTCRKLTEHDYQIIKDNLTNPEYLIGIDKVKVVETEWHKKN